VGLLDGITARSGDRVALKFDYFWTIVDPRIGSDLSPQDPDATVAQVSALLEQLSAMTQAEDDSVRTLGTKLRWAAELLTALAAQLEMGDAPSERTEG